MEKIIADYHVHCGQYYDCYFQPAHVIKSLAVNRIKEAWISSTTSCISWRNQKEKNYLIKHINFEISEAVHVAKECAINLTPLYWVVPQRHFEGESVADIMDNSLYKGFKIHTKIGWDFDSDFINNLFRDICEYALKTNIPILIHTGIDNIDCPKRFEYFYSEYKNVKFVLAHCKNTEEIIKLFRNYDNVYGDTAFCPQDCLKKIFNAGFINRMHFGSDFPINYWFEMTDKKKKNYKNDLIISYKNLVSKNTSTFD